VRHLYSLLTYVLRPVAVAIVLWRGLRNRRYWIGLGERFGFGTRVGTTQALWVHAVSLGEVTAAAALVRALRARYPETPLLLTTATLTGRARAQALFGDTITVRFLPYDTPGAMRRFLARVRPRLAIIMETELWPNVFHQCRRRGIPIVLANARLSLKSVARYRRFGALFRGAVDGVTIAAQGADDAQRFLAIGAEPSRTRVIGNLKFDVAVDTAVVERGLALRSNLWPARPVWIAGSTHHGEEEIALTAHARLQTDIPDALLLLVPRHPERFQAVADLLNRRGFRFERRSSDDVVRADCSVLLVDSVGELASLYASVDVAFVGGSLVPVGGHNLLEPAALGVPVIMGPYQSNARDIAQMLLHEGAALQVTDAVDLYERLRELMMNGASRQRVGACGLQVVAANQGSLTRLLDLIGPLMAPDGRQA
jgi:3-deoxy-D-manno-octulosonic-acid transferase